MIFKPVKYFTLKSVYGQQRSDFTVANSKIYATDLDFIFSDVLKLKNTEIASGISYVDRDETTEIVNPNFSNLTNTFAGRLNLVHNSFYAGGEYNIKSNDAIVQINNQVSNNFIKPGNALFINSGYSKKDFGIDATFRRLEA